ncbi:hypothetical protein HYH02_004814 [Chlamydomonas schloesseri]|uniref:Uncharacterized protein n=1 Tax=Chlamydomonas schloesseri TaxID=2026947 RepID=A0A836B7W5_9CHLO|nr:hypothetical protein HYH02_004814 [Chlamydomonas schloesseri]|eukprot:KAG2450307.1 hypothetical protein HYH02_004814 [Chlamydomonas schloesseri]
MDHNSALEVEVLKRAATGAAGLAVSSSLSVEELQKWLVDAQAPGGRRASMGARPTECGPECRFEELEQRYRVTDVWGHNTTPSMQMLECIQQVKAALVAGVPGDEDSMSCRAFAALSILSIAAALAVVLVW